MHPTLISNDIVRTLKSNLNPIWQILEKSSKYFLEVSIFRRVGTQTDFWKTRFMNQTDSWMSFPEIGLVYAQEIRQ